MYCKWKLRICCVIVHSCTTPDRHKRILNVCKSYCCIVHFCRITSFINQQIHLHNFHIKHLKSLRHVSILSDHHQGALLFLAKVILYYNIRPPLWSSGQSFWLQIQRSRVRFPALPDFLSGSGSGTGYTQPREVN